MVIFLYILCDVAWHRDAFTGAKEWQGNPFAGRGYGLASFIPNPPCLSKKHALATLTRVRHCSIQPLSTIPVLDVKSVTTPVNDTLHLHRLNDYAVVV